MKVGPNLLLSVRLVCRLRALGSEDLLVGRSYLVSSGLVTVVLQGCSALHFMPFGRRPNISSGLDKNKFIIRSHALEKTFWFNSKGLTEKRYAGCTSHTSDGRATRHIVILKFHLQIQSPSLLSSSICIARRF